MVDFKKLSENIKHANAGRKAAVPIVKMIQGKLEDSHKRFVDAFWEKILDEFPKDLAPPPLEFKPMPEDESKHFGQKTMPFGKFKGMKIDQIDKGYLEWFANQPDDFKQDLQRYLASDRVKRED